MDTRKESAIGKRIPAGLRESLENRLARYAAVGAAAGVGVLASGPTAQAKIVYTPANVTIVPNQVAAFDLNHDGIKDFFLIQSTRFKTGTLSIDPVRPSNRIIGMKPYASALPAGAKIGPGGKFQQDHDLMASTYFFYNYGSKGPWKGNTTSYLGLKFLITGEVHYGWARVQVATTIGKFPEVTATLTGYAYETVANKAIVAGKTKGPNVVTLQPATLGMLAQGRR